MSFFARIWNLLKGMFSGFAGALEENNPEAVYESAINERLAKNKELTKAVSGLIALRNKASAELETKEAKLKETLAMVETAVAENDDEAALNLLDFQAELEKDIERLSAELTKLKEQAEDAKAGLSQFQAEIDKLRREKETMLAAKSNAEARIMIQESLSGLSMEADTRALDNVRQGIEKLKAEADIGAELEDNSLDKRLAEIKAKTNSNAAKAKLEEMKRQRAAMAQGAQQAKSL